MTTRTLAGVAQLSERSEVAPREVAGANPAARSTPAQLFAEGLRLDPASWEIGRADGAAGLPWRGMTMKDALAYASGYVQGKAERGCCSGERAQGEAA